MEKATAQNYKSGTSRLSVKQAWAGVDEDLKGLKQAWAGVEKI